MIFNLIILLMLEMNWSNKACKSFKKEALTQVFSSEFCETFKSIFFREHLLVTVPSFIKVGLSPSKKICVICLIESPLKMMKNVFYFILKALFVLKIFKFLSRLFSHAGKTA